MGIAAFSNFLLNLWWIPKFGLIGAAWSTLVGYALALFLSIYKGKKVLIISIDWNELGKVICASGLMLLVLIIAPTFFSLVGLVLTIIIGGIVYGITILCFDVGGI